MPCWRWTIRESSLRRCLRRVLACRGIAHAVRRVRDKLAFRRLLQEREFLCPAFHHLPTGEDPRKLVPELKFPVVVKARRLSGSRGVIRADDAEALVRAVNWVRAIQSRADLDAQEP